MTGPVLIGCEESQEVCKAFRALGVEAYSCDLQPCSGGRPEWHIQGDIKEVLTSRRWALIVAHPPCTRLCNSGVRWLIERNLWSELAEAVRFFNYFTTLGKIGHRVAIENPIPHKYAREGFIYGSGPSGTPSPGIGQYSQLIQPWQFGHGETKATCLWLYGLPELKPTKIVSGREGAVWKMAPSADRAKLRSKTYPGIARAMAQQWTEYLSKL